MTTVAPTTESNVVNIQIGAFYDQKKVDAFLIDIFGMWERGKVASGNGFRANPEEWGEIVKTTAAFCCDLVSAAINEASGPLAKVVQEAAFADGFIKGESAAFTKGGLSKAKAGKHSEPFPAPQSAPVAIDSDAILKTIGEEMRKMFDAGLAQGKLAADKPAIDPGEVVRLEKPSGEVVRVQRNAAGDIVGAVKEFVYQADG